MSSRARVRVLLCSLLCLLALTPFAAARPEADSTILFIGDGMGPSQVELAAGALGQPLTMQRFPYSGTVTTCNVSGEITDSAAAGTALATGVKTNNGMLGLSPDGRKLETILERAMKRGKSVGVITNDAIWGATPSSFLAHVGSRGERAQIARQVAKSRARVMMGYWKDELLPKSAGGKREDNRDLIAWLKTVGYGVVYTREELLQSKSLNLVGLFEDGPAAPDLATSVAEALERLGTNRRGFLLVVEQARVDWEPGDPSAVARDVLELDQAVSVAQQYALHRGRTLVVVTADHETGGLVITDPGRLHLLACVTESSEGIARHLLLDRSNVAQVMSQCAGITDLTPQEADLIRQAKDPAEPIGAIISACTGLQWTSGGDHTATPVRVYATGPGAARFTGELDNTQIPQKIAVALGIGPLPSR